MVYGLWTGSLAHEGILTGQSFPSSRNWLALEGAISPESPRPLMSKHQKQKIKKHNKYTGHPWKMMQISFILKSQMQASGGVFFLFASTFLFILTGTCNIPFNGNNCNQGFMKLLLCLALSSEFYMYQPNQFPQHPIQYIQFLFSFYTQRSRSLDKLYNLIKVTQSYNEMLLFCVLYSVSRSLYFGYLLVSLLIQLVSAAQNLGQFFLFVYVQPPSESRHHINLRGINK